MLKSIAVLATLAIATSTQAATPRDQMVVTPAWLASHAADKDLVVLFTGDAAAFQAGHIAGAHLVPANGLSVTGPTGLTLELPTPDDLHNQLQALGISDKSRIVVVYGQGRLLGATRIMFTLDAAGLGSHASMLDGGQEAWVKEGHPVTDQAVVVTPGVLAALKMTPQPADAAFVGAHTKAKGFEVIDARATTYYDGEQAGQGGVKGHIPGAVSLPFSTVSTPDAKLKSPEELAALFKDAGVKPGDEVVVYCHVGSQASAVLFAARSLGIKADLYDGSFQDWAKQNLPVENPTPAK